MDRTSLRCRLERGFDGRANSVDAGHPEGRRTGLDALTSWNDDTFQALCRGRRETPHIEYEVGDFVVYPHHGAGTVLKKEIKEMIGEKREYLTIKILHNDMTVMVPCENAGLAGLRRVIDEETVKKVLAVLEDDVSEMPKNWNRRFKHNRDKIKTGDIFELAEVVRNLSIRELDKGLSTGEKQMYGRAKKILASELMYARDMGEDEATEFLEALLDEIAQSRLTRPSRGEVLVD